MKPFQPIVPHQSIDAAIASTLDWLNWLAYVIRLIGDPSRSRTLKRWTKRLERKVELAIFAMAFKRFQKRVSRRTRRPRFTPAGFRLTRGHSYLMLKGARIRVRGKAAIRARIGALQAALRHPERAIARFMKQMRCGLAPSRLVAAAPPACAWRDAVRRDLAQADSS